MSTDDNTETEAPGSTSSDTARGRRRSSRSAGPPAGSTAASGSVVTESGAVEYTEAESAEESASAESSGASEVATSTVEESSGPDESRTRSWPLRILAALGVLVTLGLIAAVVVLSIAKHSEQERDARRAEFVQAARQSVVNLTTIHPDTAKQDVQRILDNASGDFKAEFDGRVDPFVSIVTDAKVATDGNIIEAGLESETDDSANVLVAARSTVTNAADNKPSPRDFRLRVTITDTDGKLTTSKVEFVP